MAAKMFAETL